MTFADAAQRFVAIPRKPNTAKAYAQMARRAAALGSIPLDQITNRHLKEFVEGQQGSPASIRLLLTFVKLVVASVVNDDGDSINAKPWNNKFIAAPRVKPREQRTPVATREQIESMCAGVRRTSLFVAIAAATGLRVSEILDPETTYDSNLGVIHVARGKTDAAERDVYLTADFNAWLKTRGLPKIDITTLYRELRRLGLPPCHSYRRFRATHCRRAGMVEEILKNQLGHAANTDITDRYSKLTQDVEFTRREVERIGIGFSL